MLRLVDWIEKFLDVFFLSINLRIYDNFNEVMKIETLESSCVLFRYPTPIPLQNQAG